MNHPTVTVEVVFLGGAEGGRQLPPDLSQAGSYRPHIVIQDRATRRAIIDENNVVREEYLGVTFRDGPKHVRHGESIRCTLTLVYFPEVSYSHVEEGATFTIREGSRVVGHGVVLERADPMSDDPGKAVQ
jgi:translation elongation factor EF-Tu-like GTPase